MKIDFCLLLTGLAAVSGVLNSPRTPAPTPDPLWNPIDPRQFPPAKPTVKEKSEKKKKKKKKKEHEVTFGVLYRIRFKFNM
jgi:hypothetical protein